MTAAIVWAVGFVLALFGIILCFRASILIGILAILFPFIGIVVELYYLARQENLITRLFGTSIP